MARLPRPWLRKGRGWFVTLDGKQIPLGKDRKLAYQRFYEFMNNPNPRSASEPPLVAILDEFLEWCRRNRALATFQSYKEKLQSFIDATPSGILARDLKPIHVQRWLDANPRWSNTTAHTQVTVVQRALNWATRMEIIASNPIRVFEKPPKEPRDEIITEPAYRELIGAVQDNDFRDLVTIHWESGCRPQESLRVEAKFVDLENARWVFPVKKSKGKRRPRIVYLNDRALEITARRMYLYPEGPIFRNTSDRPWTKDSVGCRFERLRKHLGRRYCLYLFRHAFATRMLEAGLDALTVALLLGHSNPAMLSTTYQHLGHNPGHLLHQLRSASQSSSQ